MDQFVSTFTNKIDAKGRVSVPATFRAVLAREGGEGIFCYPSLDSDALDAGGNRLVKTIDDLLQSIAPYSDERDQLSTALYGESEILKLDKDGRTMLPKRLREFSGITDKVTFVGLGDKFQVWQPEKFELHRARARQKVKELRKLFGAGNRLQGGSERGQE